MQREEGFIVLDDVFAMPKDITFDNVRLPKFLARESDVAIVKLIDEKLVFRFYYKGEYYYFKHTHVHRLFNELLYEEICRCLKIDFIECDLARVGNYKGLISKDYRQKNCKYIDGKEILEAAGLISEVQDNRLKYNSIENIYIALKSRYGSNANFNDCIKIVMKKLVSMLLVDILTYQTDRHYRNWQIVESDNGDFDLVPNFDNEMFTCSHPCLANFALSVKEQSSIEINEQEILEDFDIQYPNLLRDSLWTISQENLDVMFNRIEKKIGTPIADFRKEEYRERFLKIFDHLIESLDILPSCKLIEGKTVQEIWPFLKRKADAFGEAIAISLITPSSIIHALPEHDYIHYHQEIMLLVLRKLYNLGEESDLASEDVIDDLEKTFKEGEDFILCSYVQRGELEVFIAIPAYITSKELEELKKLNEFYKKKDATIFIKVSDYDPRMKRCAVLKMFMLNNKKMSDNPIERAIDFLVKNDRITDYEVDFSSGSKKMK